MSRKIILQFKAFEICEQKICTKMSNLNNGITALETLLVKKTIYALEGRVRNRELSLENPGSNPYYTMNSFKSWGQLVYLF